MSTLSALAPDAEKMSYTLGFAWKYLVRKMKRSRSGLWLPQEIVDHIVDHIWDDRPALLVCIHLSRAWYLAARPHLYRTFTASDPARFKTVDSLRKIGVIHIVRKIFVIQKEGQEDFVLPPKALARLNAFTHLQELELTFIDVGKLVLGLHDHCDVLRSNVRTLVLECTTGSVKRIICFINLFFNLENLTVNHINKVATDDSELPVIKNSPPLTGKLSLFAFLDQEFTHELASMPNGIKFHTVDLRLCREVQEILDGCAGSMNQLVWHDFDPLGAQDSTLHRGGF